MASVTRADFEKSVLRIEERLLQIEQNAGAQQIASDATLQSFQKEMRTMSTMRCTRLKLRSPRQSGRPVRSKT